jgi:hypothetical protein
MKSFYFGKTNSTDADICFYKNSREKYDELEKLFKESQLTSAGNRRARGAEISESYLGWMKISEK